MNGKKRLTSVAVVFFFLIGLLGLGIFIKNRNSNQEIVANTEVAKILTPPTLKKMTQKPKQISKPRLVSKPQPRKARNVKPNRVKQVSAVAKTRPRSRLPQEYIKALILRNLEKIRQCLLGRPLLVKNVIRLDLNYNGKGRLLKARFKPELEEQTTKCVLSVLSKSGIGNPRRPLSFSTYLKLI